MVQLNLLQWKIFTEDISSRLNQFTDDYFDLNSLITNRSRDMFNIKEYTSKGSEAISLVESLLNSGEIVCVRTCYPKLNFRMHITQLGME